MDADVATFKRLLIGFASVSIALSILLVFA